MSIQYPIKNAYTLSKEEIISALKTDVNKGLTQAEARMRINKYGLNAYAAQKQKPIWLMLLLQFKSPIVYLLLIAIAVTVYFQNYTEAMAIGAVIIINSLIGFFMELQARSSMNALKEMDITLSKVIRDGKCRQIPSEKITIGGFDTNRSG